LERLETGVLLLFVAAVRRIPEKFAGSFGIFCLFGELSPIESGQGHAPWSRNESPTWAKTNKSDLKIHVGVCSHSFLTSPTVGLQKFYLPLQA
jgi:hypothetical protein